MILWGHNRLLLDKVKNIEEAVWYVRQIDEFLNDRAFRQKMERFFNSLKCIKLNENHYRRSYEDFL